MDCTTPIELRIGISYGITVVDKRRAIRNLVADKGTGIQLRLTPIIADRLVHRIRVDNVVGLGNCGNGRCKEECGAFKRKHIVGVDGLDIGQCY